MTHPSAMQPTSSASSAEQIDIVAKAIYDAFEYTGAGSKPSWWPIGNSDKQTEARKYAEAAIAAIVPPVVQAPIFSEDWINEAYRLIKLHADFANEAGRLGEDASTESVAAYWAVVNHLLNANTVAAPIVATVPSDMVLMPRTLTAENGAKAELSGEFKEQVEVLCPECDQDEPDLGCTMCDGHGRWIQDVPVEWTTIKNIYRKAVECCAAPSTSEQASDVRNGAIEADK